MAKRKASAIIQYFPRFVDRLVHKYSLLLNSKIFMSLSPGMSMQQS